MSTAGKAILVALLLVLLAGAVLVVVSRPRQGPAVATAAPAAAPTPGSVDTPAATPASPTAADPAGMHFYFGNLHSHVGQYSHEAGVPPSITYDEAFDYAADPHRGHLDFLAITVHNHEVDPVAYPKLREAVARHDEPGRFVPIAGQEFSTISTGNHLNVFETDSWVDPREVMNGDFRTLYEAWLPAHRTAFTFAQFNHPDSSDFTGEEGREYGRAEYGGDLQALERASAPWVRALEIIKTHTTYEGQDFPHMGDDPKRLGAYYTALSAGWHLGPAANQDNHRLNYGSAAACRTVVVAPTLTRPDILRALLARRFYASEDYDLKITFRMGAQWMGSEVPVGSVQPLTVAVHDDDEPDATYRVRLLEDEVGAPRLTGATPAVREFSLRDNESVSYTIPNPKPGMYFLLAVRQSRTGEDPGPVQTADDAWTAPIWISAQ